MTKLCRDCRHSAYQRALRHGWGGIAQDSLREGMLCHHGASGDVSAVTGFRTHDACARMRAGRLCGEDGKLWEAADDAQDS